MLTDRFKSLERLIAQLPPDLQDELAAALEEALADVSMEAEQGTQAAPLEADVRAAIDRALAQHAASLQYLKDK